MTGCKPACACQCNRMSCECWDGIIIKPFDPTLIAPTTEENPR